MKILHLCLANFYIDNFGYQENLITKYHKKLGFDVTILASRINYDSSTGEQYLSEPNEYINEHNIKVKRINYKFNNNFIYQKFSKQFRLYENTFEHIVEERPDVIFVHGLQFWDISKLIKYKKKNKDVKIFIDNHADYINSARNFLSKSILHKIIWRNKANLILPYTEKFWGVTPNRCDFLEEVYNIPQNKIGLLPMGADIEKIDFKNKDKIRKKIREKHSINQEDFLLITGGKIDKRKKIDNLLRAMSRINYPNIKLLLFGVSTPIMKDIIDKLTKNNNIIKIGWIEPDEIYNYYLASDLAVFPGTHSVLWEQAVGSGLPAVFRKWKGMTHVDIGGNCRFIDNSNPGTIKEFILDIYNDYKGYEQMKDKAINKGVEYFSYKNIALRSIDLK